MIVLRNYQVDGLNQIRDHFLAGRRSVLYVSPTGSGKTSLTAHVIARTIENGKRAWFAVHRRELCRQSVETLENSAGLNVGVIAAGFGSNGSFKAQVCSIQSLMKRWRNYTVPDLLIVDEAHHQASRSWSGLLAELRAVNPNLRVLGLTATPARLDGRGLAPWFEVMVEGPTTATLISQGYLAPYRLFAPSRPDLSKVHIIAGDYNRHELDIAMQSSTVVGDAIKEYTTRCPGKRALIFMWSVSSSSEMAEAFRRAGIPAAHIDGHTDERLRDSIVKRFREGEIKVLTNCEIVTEGFDLPAIEACFLLRPTQSLQLYLQMVGRALRPYPGKEHALLIDHAGLVFRHGFPDAQREWTLDGIEKPAKGAVEAPIRQCMKCFAVLPISARACQYCGCVFEIKERQIKQEAGELEEVTDAVLAQISAAQRRQEQGRSQSYVDLMRIERERGYKRGWADKVWNARQKRNAQKKTYPVATFSNDKDYLVKKHARSAIGKMAEANRPKKKLFE